VATSVTCLVGDKRSFTGTLTAFHQPHALDFQPTAPTPGVTVNAVGTATVAKHVTIVAGCSGTGATWTDFGAQVANVTRVHGVSARHTTGSTPAGPPPGHCLEADPFRLCDRSV
jgi:hypothetical protein